MDLGWVRDIRRCREAVGVASFFKQSAGPRLEMGIELDGQLVRAFPMPRVGWAGARRPA
jgi:protein gp37